MISSNWLFQWKSFVSNKIQPLGASQGAIDQVRISENEKIGILPPGQISNLDLFLKFNEKES